MSAPLTVVFSVAVCGAVATASSSVRKAQSGKSAQESRKIRVGSAVSGVRGTRGHQGWMIEGETTLIRQFDTRQLLRMNEKLRFCQCGGDADGRGFRDWCFGPATRWKWSWITAGQQAFSCTRRNYRQAADGILPACRSDLLQEFCSRAPSISTSDAVFTVWNVVTVCRTNCSSKSRKPPG